MLVPGIMGVAMMMTGVQTVAMPLLMEFQFTREIEDRLLAPIGIEWVAVQKILSGTFNALISGAMVALPARLILGSDLHLDADHLGLLVIVGILVAVFSAAGGLTLGCSVWTDPYRTGVQPGARADDHVWLRLLSLERAPELPLRRNWCC